MNTFVIDARVAAKWILPSSQEPLTLEALALLSDWTAGKIRIIVPDFLWIELANILWKAIRRGRTTQSAAEAGPNSLRRRKIPAFRSAHLLDSAFNKAVIYDRTVYDSLYIALAVESKGVLVTADQTFANALAGSFSVKWLGAV
ncbi:MAG: type II toxin-antitoxin system VapC family toxin [Candidatus Acidiferrum sp.]